MANLSKFLIIVNENTFIIDARVGIDQLNELFNIVIEGDGFDTMGGFVYQQLGKIASQGDTIKYGNLNIEVISTIGRRIKKLRVTKTSTPDHPDKNPRIEI